MIIQSSGRTGSLFYCCKREVMIYVQGDPYHGSLIKFYNVVLILTSNTIFRCIFPHAHGPNNEEFRIILSARILGICRNINTLPFNFYECSNDLRLEDTTMRLYEYLVSHNYTTPYFLIKSNHSYAFPAKTIRQ